MGLKSFDFIEIFNIISNQTTIINQASRSDDGIGQFYFKVPPNPDGFLNDCFLKFKNNSSVGKGF